MRKQKVRQKRQEVNLDIRSEWATGSITKAWSDLWICIFDDIFNAQVARGTEARDEVPNED